MIMKPFMMIKWYFDFVSESGDVLYAYFIAYRLFSRTRSLISAHRTLPDGSHLRDSITTGAGISDRGGDLSLGGHFWRAEGASFHLRLELDRMTIELVYAPTEKSWIPNPDGILLTEGPGALRWIVPIPSAQVEGTIQAGGKETKITGLGYHDVVATDIPPWRLPIRELLWGRALGGGWTVVFNQITKRQGAVLQNSYVSGRPGAGQSFAIEAGEHDAATRISLENRTLTLKLKRIVEESRVTTEDRVRSRFLRGATAGISGDPFEKKMLSDAFLGIGTSLRAGSAFHERVVWSWKK